MRPLKLTVHGFTSFRDRIEIDFSRLDLFAITGPTGAGKSSLIDALVFALYGAVPRVGDEYKQLISHGSERLSVQLEFGVGRERYRIARTVRPDKKPSEQRLERITGGRAEPIADRAREIRAEVDRILGLDYDGFTRAVVLPQGQFDAFLKGEPKERRKILVALLGLEVYERMQQIAHQRSAAARTEAEFIRRQLETDFAEATDEVLERKKAALDGATASSRQAEAALASLLEAVAIGQRVRSLRGERDRLESSRVAEKGCLERARATLDGAGEARRRLDRTLDELLGRKEAFDEARYTVLVAAKPLADQLARLEQGVSRAAAATGAKRRDLQEARTALAVAEKSLPAFERAGEDAQAAERTARAEREAGHREHSALAIRRGLKPGDPCPVCARPVTTLPEGEEPALDALDKCLVEAEAAARQARERLHQARLACEQKRTRAEGLGADLEQAEGREKEAEALVANVRVALAGAGFDAGVGAAALVVTVEGELQALERAKEARAETEARQKEIERQRARLDVEVAAAAAQRDVVQGRLVELDAKRGETDASLDEAGRALAILAARDGWSDLLPPTAGRDEADVVEACRSERQREATVAQSHVARLAVEVATTERALVRAAELVTRRAALENEAALARTLSDHLKAHELIAWIQEEALARLAEAGSRHLQELSQGRYTLRLGPGTGDTTARADQDFYVVDAWNGDSVRSVRTLSGGETFLASLALALALAESLTELATESRANDALESLFLDEGFGTLDAESLDTVVSALDALHGGDRVVGIVTHRRELAERLPARLEVQKRGAAATVAVV